MRGAKHARAPSAVSREPKRHRDDDESVPLSGFVKRPLSDSDPTLSEEEKDSSTELGDRRTAEDTTLDDEAWLRKSQKVARTSNVDSPSKRKRRIKTGAKDPFITSPPGSKARGKRRADDSDDHEIGDQWTDLNGLRWRIDDDGELRREAVVLELRLKYPNMPKDSRHPDAKRMVPVLVEKYLTETEYEDMREKKLLGFQEEERQREIEEAEERIRKRQQDEEEQRRKRVAKSGRPITTPKKVRNVQALFSTGTSPEIFNTPYKRLSLSMENDSATTKSRRTERESLRVPLSSSSPSRTQGATLYKRFLGSLRNVF